jgi:hypothetical protein
MSSLLGGVGGVCWEVDFSLLAGVVKLLMLLCPRLFCSFLIDASLSLALIDPLLKLKKKKDKLNIRMRRSVVKI